VETAKRVEKLRKKYERDFATSEARRVAYHRAVLDLLEQGGPGLRNFADELGVADRLFEQTLTANKPRRRSRRRLARTTRALAAVILLLALTLGALRVAKAPPFVPMVRVPRVMDMPEAAAVQRLKAAGLRVRLLAYRRSVPRNLFHRVLGVSHPAGTPAWGELLPKGSTITLYVVTAPKIR
jgi:PASTA domain